jgi:hypothetical protein
MSPASKYMSGLLDEWIVGLMDKGVADSRDAHPTIHSSINPATQQLPQPP